MEFEVLNSLVEPTLRHFKNRLPQVDVRFFHFCSRCREEQGIVCKASDWVLPVFFIDLKGRVYVNDLETIVFFVEEVFNLLLRGTVRFTVAYV